jgi:hypothetical protein
MSFRGDAMHSLERIRKSILDFASVRTVPERAKSEADVLYYRVLGDAPPATRKVGSDGTALPADLER